ISFVRNDTEVFLSKVLEKSCYTGSRFLDREKHEYYPHISGMTLNFCPSDSINWSGKVRTNLGPIQKMERSVLRSSKAP
ncbi:MAG: hypothetical protein AAFN10_18800, partial [Bacteroidota bacterium]